MNLGKLTLNVAQIYFEKNIFKINLNLRIPILTPIIDIGNAFLKSTSSYLNIDFDTIDYKDRLLIKKDNTLVQTLCNIYNETMHSDVLPIAIGGATFARAFPNCISFGPNFPGQQDMCHQVDEFISISNLMFCTKLYAKAIYELSK